MRWRPAFPRLDGEAHGYRRAARAAAAAGQLDDAIEALGQAVLLRPDSADLHVELGRLLHRSGRVEAARRAYERALDVHPGHRAARAAAIALPAGPPTRANFAVGDLLDSSRGTAGHGGARYRVVAVRKGGFGAVYIVDRLVDDAPDGMRVALKSFDARLLWSDEDRRRFLIEATTWINLDPHPNIVTARSATVIEGFPCLVMDYIDGGDLGERLARGTLSARTAVGFGIQLCDGMESARAQLGLVHRDLKPSNLMLTRDGTLKITDFGLARTLRQAQERSLNLGGRHPAGRALYTTVAGTPAYMAPEQFDVSARLDTRADVFAFGVMLHQMLSGRLPPAGRAHQHVGRPGGAAVPGDLLDLIRDCVDPDPDRRPATFGEVRARLDAPYRRLAGVAPSSPATPGRVDAYTWIERSVAFRHLGLPEQSLAAADRGLAQPGTDNNDDVVRGRLWQVRGLALVDLGRSTEALDSYDRALEFNPAEPSAWICKAAVLGRLGRFEESLGPYDRSLAIAPDSHQALVGKATALGDLERIEEADALFRRAARLAPRDTALLVNWASVLQRQGRHDAALECITQALDIAPRYGFGWYRRGRLLTELGRVDEGLAAYDRALEIDRRDVRAWTARGDALAATDQPDDALAAYDQALALDPQYLPAQARRDRLLTQQR